MDDYSYMTLQERMDFYQKEIDKRTPPTNEHQMYMREVYENLLRHARLIQEMDLKESGEEGRSTHI